MSWSICCIYHAFTFTVVLARTCQIILFNNCLWFSNLISDEEFLSICIYWWDKTLNCLMMYPFHLGINNHIASLLFQDGKLSSLEYKQVRNFLFCFSGIIILIWFRQFDWNLLLYLKSKRWGLQPRIINWMKYRLCI